MCHDEFYVFEPLLCKLVIGTNLNRLSVTVRGVVVTLTRKEVTTKIKPSLFKAPLRAVRGLRGELLGMINVSPAERCGSCVDQVSRILGIQAVRLHKQIL